MNPRFLLEIINRAGEHHSINADDVVGGLATYCAPGRKLEDICHLVVWDRQRDMPTHGGDYQISSEVTRSIKFAALAVEAITGAERNAP